MPRKGGNTKGGCLISRAFKIKARIRKYKGRKEEIKGQLLEFAKRINISDYARSAFKLISSLAQNCCLVPIKQLGNGKFVEASPWQKFTCYIMSAFGALTCAFKLWTTGSLALESDFDFRLTLCIGSFFIALVAWLPSFAFLFVQNKSIVMLNSVAPTLEYLDRKCGDRQKRDLFSNWLLGLKIVGFTSSPVLVPGTQILVMLYLMDLPATWIGFWVNAGLVPESGYWHVFASIVSMIVETGTTCLLWINVVMVTHMVFVAAELLRTYLEDVG